MPSVISVQSMPISTALWAVRRAPLQVGPGFGGDEMDGLALVLGDPQHPAERGPGDAVREHAVAILQQVGGVLATHPADPVTPLDLAVDVVKDGVFGVGTGSESD